MSYTGLYASSIWYRCAADESLRKFEMEYLKTPNLRKKKLILGKGVDEWMKRGNESEAWEIAAEF